MLLVYIVLNGARERAFGERSTALAPPAYQTRIKTMASRAARARTTAGLWLLEAGLAEFGHGDNYLRRVGFGTGGRPEFAAGPYFSIAHGKALVACALDADAALGLDVEARRGGVSARLRRSIAPNGNFFAAWCAREATVKATGHVGLARIRAVELGPACARLDGRDWHLAWPALAPGYTACVASAAPINPATMICRDLGPRFDAGEVLTRRPDE